MRKFVLSGLAASVVGGAMMLSGSAPASTATLSGFALATAGDAVAGHGCAHHDGPETAHEGYGADHGGGHSAAHGTAQQDGSQHSEACTCLGMCQGTTPIPAAAES